MCIRPEREAGTAVVPELLTEKAGIILIIFLQYEHCVSLHRLLLYGDRL
jgi:hypothetical protein